MIITDYYNLQRLPDTKSKTRFDVLTSTGSYPEFENLRNKKGELFFYFVDVPDKFKADVRRKADKSLTSRLGKNVSSIFIPNVTLSFGFGDVQHTSDALLLVFNADYTQIEIFICRGQRNNRNALYNLLTDGELSGEIEAIRKRAVTISVTNTTE